MIPKSPPAHFVTPSHRLLVSPEFSRGASALGLDDARRFNHTLDTATRVAGGRGPNFLLSSEHWPGRVRLRPIRRGGLLGRFAGDLYLSPERSEREFRIWQILETRGAPIPPIAFAANRRRGVFWNPSLGTLNREDAVDAFAWLASGTRSEKVVSRAGASIARSIRRFHDTGAVHGDFHPGNVLLQESTGALRCWLVDLGRTRLRESPTPAERVRDLMRFMRSLEKAKQRDCLRPRVRARFLSAYCDGDRSLRRRLLRSSVAESRRLRRHRWSWRLRRALLSGLLATLCLACSGSETESNRSNPVPARLSLLATGDTGRSRSLAALFEGQLAVAHALTEEDRSRPVDGLILLGDNFYWHGLDREHLVERVLQNLVVPYCHFLDLSGPRSSEVLSGCSTSASTRNPVPIYAVLGNHDLELPESADLQREAVRAFVPEWRMASTLAEVFELPHGVSLILFESEIAIDDRDAMQAALVRAIQTAKGPWRIIATHRPIATDDLGGVPLGGYPIWVRDAIASADRPVQLVLAGHHHNLQAFALQEPSRLLQIGAGSGSRATPPLARNPPGSLFGAIQLGFARIDLIGAGASERLLVSLYGTAPWPFWARLTRHDELAKFEVGPDGSVRTVSGKGAAEIEVEVESVD